MQARLYLERKLWEHLTLEEDKVRRFQALRIILGALCCFLEDAFTRRNSDV